MNTSKADPVLIAHSGKYAYHDDDCLCVMGDQYCNRDGWVWSCCGSCKQDSDCSGSNMHPTYWNHPDYSKTLSGQYENQRPVYKSNAEIRKLFGSVFQSPQ